SLADRTGVLRKGRWQRPSALQNSIHWASPTTLTRRTRRMMKNLKVMMMSCVLALALAATAGAQMGGMMGHGAQPRGFFNPIVGSGAQYEIQSSGKDSKMVVEIDVVGKESVDGKDGYWF